MHSRDATVLIDLLWFNVVHFFSLFQYFFPIYYASWKFLIFSALVQYMYILLQDVPLLLLRILYAIFVPQQ